MFFFSFLMSTYLNLQLSYMLRIIFFDIHIFLSFSCVLSANIQTHIHTGAHTHTHTKKQDKTNKHTHTIPCSHTFYSSVVPGARTPPINSLRKLQSKKLVTPVFLTFLNSGFLVVKSCFIISNNSIYGIVSLAQVLSQRCVMPHSWQKL